MWNGSLWPASSSLVLQHSSTLLSVASLIILCCTLVWIFEVALMSCSQAAVTQRILMKLIEIDSSSFTEAAGQRTGSWAGKSFSFGSKNTPVPLTSQRGIFATCWVSAAGGSPCPDLRRGGVTESALLKRWSSGLIHVVTVDVALW